MLFEVFIREPARVRKVLAEFGEYELWLTDVLASLTCRNYRTLPGHSICKLIISKIVTINLLTCGMLTWYFCSIVEL